MNVTVQMHFEPSKFASAVQREVLRESGKCGWLPTNNPAEAYSPLVPTSLPDQPNVMQLKVNVYWPLRVVLIPPSFCRFGPPIPYAAGLRLTERQTKRQNASDWLSSTD
jgi:hypothetical protein